MLRIAPALLVAPLLAHAQTIERPTVKVGDECAYDVFDNLKTDSAGNPEKIAERRGTVASIESERITIKWDQKILVSRDTGDLEGGTWVYNPDLNFIDRNGRAFSPAYPNRFYPLAPNAKRDGAKVQYPRLGGGDTTMTLDGVASAWEKVTVPAGPFDAIAIAWEGWYNTSTGLSRSSGRIEQKLWFTSATHCFVQATDKVYAGGGRIWSDRTYKLTGYKQ